MEEFSDFQMAVAHKKSTVGRGNTTGGGSGVWVLDHRPQQPMPTNLFQKSGPRSDHVTHPQSFPVVPSVPSDLLPGVVGSITSTFSSLESAGHSHPEMSSVGSRLANYNLQKSLPTGLHVTGGGRVNADRFLLGMASPSSSNSQSLLMGEEDRYAALRSLVGLTPENSQASSAPLELNAGGWQDQNIRGARKSKLNEEFASDFGDFQSFTGAQQVSGQTVLSESAASIITCGLGIDSNVIVPQHTGGLTKISNGSNYELEFGDFVSVNPTFGQPPQAPFSKISQVDFKKRTWSVISPSAQNPTLEQLNFFGSNLPSQEITTTSEIQGSMVTNGDLSSAHFSAKGSIYGAEPFQRPSFIKTSLIGYDTGINDIDTSKGASFEDSNNEPLDCVFMGPKDLLNNKCEKRQSLDISPETRSLASLDLGNYYASSEFNDSGKFVTDQFTPQITETALDNKICNSIVSQERGELSLSTDLPVNDKIDKYQCFKEEITSRKEQHSAKWSHCLEFCRITIFNAISLFNGASSSEVIREVTLDKKGLSYIENLLEVFLVCRRIHKSWQRIGGSTRVGNLCNDMQAQWETLSSFFSGTSVTDLVTITEDLTQGLQQEERRVCGVCMTYVERDTHSNLVDYGGIYYHSTCANLWINAVDVTLPSISSIPLSSDERKNRPGYSGN